MRHFTLDEAQEALGTVRPLAERMVDLRREQVVREAELGRVQRAVATNGGDLEPGSVRTVREAATEGAAALSRCVEEIHALGAQVKDLDQGLVDFPAHHPGQNRTVLLCWRVGEDQIDYWHGVDEGFAGRKPLPF